MAITLRSTRDVALHGVKILVYGQSGAGKTTLIRTLENPVILSAESGLLSLAGTDIPYVEVHTYEDLVDAYNWTMGSDEAKQFRTICLDSVSEIAEVILHDAKEKNKDVRQAYGSMADQVAALVRQFRDIPDRDVYLSAKAENIQDETGRLLWQPSLPGRTAGHSLPYFFDEVLALRVENNVDTGKPFRIIQTGADGVWLAKDRSGKLDMWEAPDLGNIIRKIRGEADNEKPDHGN